MAETFTNGIHIFQLAAREPTETISFSSFTNELGDGFEDSLLFGAATGNREFSMDFPVLSSVQSCELDGVTLSPYEYLWELFVRQKTTGQLFAVQSPRTNQYYLCKFKDNNLGQKGFYKNLERKLFTSSAVFSQVRKTGVSVFDPSKTSPWAHLKIESIAENFADEEALVDAAWSDSSGNSNDFSINLGGNYKANEQNGLGCVRLNGTSGFFHRAEAVTIYQALMVIRVYESSWSNQGGVLTGATHTTTNALLIGESGQAKFQNLGLSNLIYEKNGVSYAMSNQLSPMNEFGLVYIFAKDGMSFDAVQIGKDRDFAGRFAKLDIGEVILWDAAKPRSVILETAESLVMKWQP